MTQLRVLDLSGHPLSEIPESLGELTNLEELRVGCSLCYLQDFFASILTPSGHTGKFTKRITVLQVQ